MLRPYHPSGSVLGRTLLRPAVFAVVLAGFVASTLPAQSPTPTPNTGDAFRQFLRVDMDALGKLVKFKNETTKMIDNKPESKEKNAYYQGVVDALTPRIKEETEAAKTKLSRLKARLVSVADYADVLRLDAWEAVQTDLRDGLALIDPDLHTELAAEMTKKVEDIAANGTREDKAALCVLLGEDAAITHAQKTLGTFYHAKLKTLIPVVVKLSELKSPADRVIRRAAAQALAQMHAPADKQLATFDLILTVDGDDVESRRAAYRALAVPYEAASPRTMALNPITTGYTGTDLGAYKNETKSLLDKHAELVLPKFAEGLKDPDTTIRQISANAYKDITAIMLVPLDPAPNPEKDLPTSVGYDRLKDQFETIKSIQPLLEELTKHSPALIGAAADRDRAVRLQALSILSDLIEIRNRARGWREQFERAAKKPQDAARKADNLNDAAFVGEEALPESQVTPLPDRLSPALKGSLKVLVRDLSSPDRATRLAAIEVLDGLNPDVSILEFAAVVGAMNDEYVWVRRTALRILNRFGPVKPEEVVPALIPLIRNDQDSDLAKPLAVLLSRYGAKAAPAAPALTKAATAAGDPDTRIAFLQAIAAVGADAKDAIPAIAQILKPMNANLNFQAPGAPPPFAPPGVVKYDDVHVRATAAETLGRFGPLAKNAEPVLRAALNDADPDVRKAASEALLRINGK
jgi:HEAT repeats